MEISYLSTNEESRYTSNKVRCDTLVSVVASSIIETQLLNSREGDLSVFGTIHVIDDANLSGDVNVNVATGTSKYIGDINFKKLSAVAQTIDLSSVAGVTVYGKESYIKVDQTGVQASPSIKVSTTVSADDQSVVNMAELRRQMEALSSAIINGIDWENIPVKQTINFPYLAVIYLDHQIDDPMWLSAGTTFKLSDYPQFSEWFAKNNSRLRIDPKSPAADDTWYYKLNSSKTQLTLPNTKWFFQCANSLVKNDKWFKKAGLPQHNHDFSYYSLGQGGGGGGSSGSGQALTRIGTTGAAVATNSKAANIYRDSITTVQPNATLMYVYFYVGPHK